MSEKSGLTLVEGREATEASSCPLPSCPWFLEEDASWACPCRLSLSGPSPTLLSSSSSPSHVLSPSLAPALSADALSLGDLSLSPFRGDDPEAHAPVHKGAAGYI